MFLHYFFAGKKEEKSKEWIVLFNAFNKICNAYNADVEYFYDIYQHSDNILIKSKRSFMMQYFSRLKKRNFPYRIFICKKSECNI